MTIREALRNSFPFAISNGQIELISAARCLNADDDFNSSIATSREFELAKADIIKMVVMSPNVSEGGVSISFADRSAMISIANEIYGKYGEPLFGHAIPTVRALDW